MIRPLLVRTLRLASLALSLMFVGCSTGYYGLVKPLSKGDAATLVVNPIVDPFGPLQHPSTTALQQKFVGTLGLAGKPEDYSTIFIEPSEQGRNISLMLSNCSPDDKRMSIIETDMTYQRYIGNIYTPRPARKTVSCSDIPNECYLGYNGNPSVMLVLSNNYACDTSALSSYDALFVLPIALHAGTNSLGCIDKLSNDQLHSLVERRSLPIAHDKIMQARDAAARDVGSRSLISLGEVIKRTRADSETKDVWWDGSNFALENPMQTGMASSNLSYAIQSVIASPLAVLSEHTPKNERFLEYYRFMLERWAETAVNLWGSEGSRGAEIKSGEDEILNVCSFIIRDLVKFPATASSSLVASTHRRKALEIFETIQLERIMPYASAPLTSFNSLIKDVERTRTESDAEYVSLFKALQASLYFRDYRGKIRRALYGLQSKTDDNDDRRYREFAKKFDDHANTIWLAMLNRELEKYQERQNEEERAKSNLPDGTTVYFETTMESKHSSKIVTIEAVKIRSLGEKSEVSVINFYPKVDGYGSELFYQKKRLEVGRTFIVSPSQFRLNP
jgi:hypothetical protein